MEMKDIISQAEHRPWAMPGNRWLWYQEWNNVVFMHGRVEMDWLRELVPIEFTIDTFAGMPWISVVGFRMQKIGPRFLPAVNAVSDFYEVNIRTYVTVDNKPGVFFISMEGNKRLSALVARSVSGLPYVYEPFSFAGQQLKGRFLSFDYEIEQAIIEKNDFDIWVTERYCLYYKYRTKAYRYDIHHLPWPLQRVKVNNLRISYPLLNTPDAPFMPEVFHYSPGVRVAAWPVKRIDK